ncbi:T-box transcription factor TBX21 isoform X1 [Sinocyclocheilus anshuiensis]|uniref:T-box domain-containing protein n=1 Tax=Sinocyclocheilus anshuiensis TaxID=1608454 RepID=A0A671NGW3_9TELE|nr:PREDICTED: T-box transcription factor TBX21 isoform X1 [Sinocyclocheilus anshuiensis]
MGGIGRNLYLNMLNGTDAQSFAKDAELNSHLHRNRDLPDFKMGIQDTRFYYQDSIPNGQDSLTLPFHAEHHQSAGAQTGRFYAPAPLGSCHFTSRSGTGHTYVPAGADAYSSANVKDVFPSSADGYPASFQHGYPRAPMYSLPGLQVSGKTQVLLNNYPLWAKFHKYQTEMIITKQGRRMFPFLSFNISSLDPSAHYNIYVDVVLADQHHWRYQGGKWVQCGKAEGNIPGNRMYMHPDSPNTGNHWMRQEVSFGKLKLTNNKGSSNNVGQMIVLQSLHKYQPRLHIVEVKEDGTEDPFLTSKTQTFVFPETQFIAVTAYQNADITQLKIDHNPFAKGFRDNYDTLYAPPDSDRLTPSPNESQQFLPGSCYPHQPYLSDQYMSPLPQSRFYSREPVSMTQQCPKDPAASPHSRFYLPSQQGVPPNRLDFNTYESEYTSNNLYKPFPIQTSPHHPLGYYSESPFASGPVSGTNAGVWSSGRPSTQYLNHPHHSKPVSSLGWFRTISSPAASSSPSAVNSRFHSSPSLLDPQRQPLHQDKSKESGEDAWIEAPSVKSVDSADSGLFEGGESKKRRVSPYTSSTENSPPNRSVEACEKDNCSDVGYYGFYTH